MLQILLEHTKKNIIVGLCQIFVLSFLLTMDSEGQEHFSE
jgi:hypothetical protein